MLLLKSRDIYSLKSCSHHFIEYFVMIVNLTILQESIMILVWFFVEDVVELILERIDLKEEKTDAAQLASVAVRFSNKFNDDPIPDEVAEEIIAEIFEDEDENDDEDEDGNKDE